MNDLAGTGITYLSGGGQQGGKSQVTLTSDLAKRKIVSRVPVLLEGLYVEGETWTAGGFAGLYRSTDGGETWLMEKLAIEEHITSVVRHDGSRWVCGVEGTVARETGTGPKGEAVWALVDRPEAPKFGGVMYGTALPYPDVALSKLKVVGGQLYALGHGVWRLDAKGAHLELASKNLIVDLARTAEGALLAVGVKGAAFRRAEKR